MPQNLSVLVKDRRGFNGLDIAVGIWRGEKSCSFRGEETDDIKCLFGYGYYTMGGRKVSSQIFFIAEIADTSCGLTSTNRIRASAFTVAQTTKDFAAPVSQLITSEKIPWNRW